MKSPARAALTFSLPVAAALGLLLGNLGSRNLYLWDSLNALLPAPLDPRVVVVGIDDQTLNDYGRLEGWNRSLYARAIDTLEMASAKVIGLDLLLDTPAPGNDELAHVLEGKQNVVLASTSAQPRGSGRWNVPHAIAGLNLLGNLTGGKTSYFQTAYADGGALYPTLSAALAQQLGKAPKLNTQQQLLRYPARPVPVISFGDLLSGNVRFSDLQGKAVLIGVTASGVAGNTFFDSRHNPVAGVILQARALSSLLQAPQITLSPLITALLGALIAVSTVLLRGLWGFALAAATLLLSAALLKLNVLFPASTLSCIAVLCELLILAEQYWLSQQWQRVDPLTGLGNRLAFTRAVELRWHSRVARPLGLLLVNIKQFQRVNERYGRQAGNAALKQLAQLLSSQRSRRELVFRWRADEFILLLEGANEAELNRLAQRIQEQLKGWHHRDLPLEISIGQSLSSGLDDPDELIERASRDRYREVYGGNL